MPLEVKSIQVVQELTSFTCFLTKEGEGTLTDQMVESSCNQSMLLTSLILYHFISTIYINTNQTLLYIHM